ncbi:MAG: hypothetical protein KKA42_10725 [candidate division Zixibacteria bacterium]|nr:hypothetical protein [candidate division Zixibacteria bacterium]
MTDRELTDNNTGSEARTETGGGPVDEGEILAWTIHPVKKRPLVSVAVTVFIGLIGVLVYLATDSRAFCVLAIVIMLATLAKFYFPTKYQLSDRRIMVKTTTQTVYRDWKQFRSVYPDKNGVLLSPFVGASRLENFRGQYLIFGDNRDEVIAFVKARVSTPEPDSTSKQTGETS